MISALKKGSRLLSHSQKYLLRVLKSLESLSPGEDGKKDCVTQGAGSPECRSQSNILSPPGRMEWTVVGPAWLSLTPVLPSSQWDLVCTRKTLLQLSQSIFMAGILVGSLMSGIMADRSVINKPESRSKNIAPLGWTQRGDWQP